jgi:hypothetical protein
VNTVAVSDLHQQPAAHHRSIGPIGTVARLLVGLGLLGSDDQIGCALFWPIDQREHRLRPGGV